MARDVSNYGNKEAKSLPKPLTDDFTTKEKAQKSNVDRDMGKLEPSYTAGKNVKWGSPYGKQYMTLLQKLTAATGSSNSTSGHILK